MNTPAELAQRTTHRPTRLLLELMAEQGWTTFMVTRGGSASFRHPRSGIELPTPDSIPENWWGQATYQRVRGLRVNVSGTRFSFIGTWYAPAPWVQVREQTLSFKAAMAYVADNSWIPEDQS